MAQRGMYEHPKRTLLVYSRCVGAQGNVTYPIGTRVGATHSIGTMSTSIIEVDPV